MKSLNKKNILSQYITNAPSDYYLFITASILIIIGIIFSYSLSVYTVIHLGYGEFHFFIRQLFSGILAIIIMWSFSQIKPEKLLPLVSWVLFSIFLFLIVFMKVLPESITIQSGGATRWIRMPGFSISPVEFFKIGFIYYLATSFNRRLSKIAELPFKQEIILIIPYGVIFILLAIFIAVLQKELGQTLVIASVIFMMLIYANRSWKILSSIVFLGFSSFIALIALFPHRINRIQSWWGSSQDKFLDYLPDSLASILKIDSFNEAYQVGHSINAISNGGLLGQGISNGYIKLGYLGEVHTDFVLAGIAEEIGFFGLSFIVVLFLFLIIRIFKVSRRTTNNTYHLFSIGIAIMLGTSFLINAFGTSGLIPIKGLPVPLLSYGGSSLIATSIAIGLVLSISNSSKMVDKSNNVK